jgi:hypothetical protein
LRESVVPYAVNRFHNTAIFLTRVQIVVFVGAENHTSCPAQKTNADFAPKIIAWTDIILERPEAAVTLICRSTGYPLPLIQWFEEGDSDNESHRILNDDQHEASYRIKCLPKF